MLTKVSLTTANESSRLYTVESLVRNGSFSIFDDHRVDGKVLGDLVYDGKHWYSDKPPLLAALTAPVYAGLLFVTGGSAPVPTLIRPNSTYYFLSLFFSGLPAILLLYFFYRSLLLVDHVHESERIFWTGVVGLGSMIFQFATVYSNHLITALFAYLAFYLLLKARKKGILSLKLAALIGFFVGLVFALEFVIGFFMGLAVFIYFAVWKTRKELLAFIGGCLPWLIVFLVLNYLTTGSMFPWALLYLAYLGIPENATRLTVVPFSLSPARTVFNYFLALFSFKKGLFLKSPITMVAVWSMVCAMRRKNFFWREARAVVAMSVGFFTLVLAMTTDLGGGAKTLRWILPFVPLWFMFTPVTRRSRSLYTRVLLTTLIIVSITISVWSAFDPWNSGQNYTLISLLFPL